MANKYHDELGKFCSRDEMRTAITRAEQNKDYSTALSLKFDYETAVKGEKQERFIKESQGIDNQVASLSLKEKNQLAKTTDDHSEIRALIDTGSKRTLTNLIKHNKNLNSEEFYEAYEKADDPSLRYDAVSDSRFPANKFTEGELKRAFDYKYDTHRDNILRSDAFGDREVSIAQNSRYHRTLDIAMSNMNNKISPEVRKNYIEQSSNPKLLAKGISHGIIEPETLLKNDQTVSWEIAARTNDPKAIHAYMAWAAKNPEDRTIGEALLRNPNLTEANITSLAKAGVAPEAIIVHPKATAEAKQLVSENSYSAQVALKFNKLKTEGTLNDPLSNIRAGEPSIIRRGGYNETTQILDTNKMKAAGIDESDIYEYFKRRMNGSVEFDAETGRLVTRHDSGD